MTPRPPSPAPFEVKGWCPAPGRPMETGDGWLFRLKPLGGLVLPAQARAIAAIARRWGNGALELTNRGALQLRGVAAGDLGRVQAAIDETGLAQGGALSAITLAPDDGRDPAAAEAAFALASDLARVMARFPALPAKFGLVIDCGPLRLLADCPADLRIERAMQPTADADTTTRTGPLPALFCLRIDGRAQGFGLTQDRLADAVAQILAAFCDTLAAEGSPRGRMRDWHQPWPPESRPFPLVAPVPARRPALGAFGKRHLHALAFGALDAALLDELAETGPLVLTPWRMIALTHRHTHPALITDPDDPLLRVHACVGAPACAQAHGATRPLGRQVARSLRKGQSLLVSGCDKHCASGGKPADLVLTTTAEGLRFATAEASAPLVLPSPSPDKTMLHSYETNGQAIYDQSFAIIRAEADLARFSPIHERVAVRMIHASGLVGLERDIAFTPDFGTAAVEALQAGAPVLCDARMVSEGITRARLPRDNRVICTLNDPRVPAMAAAMGNTRSAAALELWRPDLAGAVVAIGNAPTALFHLLNMLADPDCPRPAAIIGCPVGFVGAAESKAALIAAPPVPALVVTGRLGGSAVTVAAVNALASEKE